MRITRLSLAVMGLVISASAGAVTTWNTSTPGIGLTSGSIYCGTNTCNTTNTGLTGSEIQMTAYSTPTLQTSGSASPTDTGNWVNAQIAIYDGNGVAITNNVQTSPADVNAPQ